MKIAIVITRGDDLGGAQMHVSALCSGLIKAGHQVHIIAGNGGTWSEMMIESGVPVEICDGMLRQISPLRDLRVVRKLSSRLSELAPDLICAHCSKAGVVAGLAARFAGIPCVYNPHGWAFADGVVQPKKSIFRVLEILAAPLSSKIICVSNYDRRIADRAGISPKRMITIENGVPDVDSSLRATPREGDPIRAIMVARFAEQKNQEFLIRTLRDLTHIHLDFVGEGPKLEAAKSLVDRLGMTSRVRFLGARTDVAELLAQSNIFVLMSKFEGFPLSTLEAMRAGLPVIVSDVGGAGEAIVDGESGFLIPVGDAETLRDRILLLAEKPDRRELMGNAARRRYETQFSADTMARRTLNLYDEVLFGKPSYLPEPLRTPLPAHSAVIRSTPERVP